LIVGCSYPESIPPDAFVSANGFVLSIADQIQRLSTAHKPAPIQEWSPTHLGYLVGECGAILRSSTHWWLPPRVGNVPAMVQYQFGIAFCRWRCRRGLSRSQFFRRCGRIPTPVR